MATVMLNGDSEESCSSRGYNQGLLIAQIWGRVSRHGGSRGGLGVNGPATRPNLGLSDYLLPISPR
ncbi:hypothetical protein J6590_054003 [Homalodisca vitripennis]|nr:hypothetical protein J6590_054003 [Homalodisca vitripennis]